ncbi:protein MIZU-KUSSEI 1 [Manihot esculenta]|nr:protein MIZU-KUSSEI 1 [Manihot esculenta]
MARSNPASPADSPESPKPPSSPPPKSQGTLHLIHPSEKKKKVKLFRVVRSVFRSFPIINPVCKIPVLQGSSPDNHHTYFSGNRVTGTLFGHRKGRVSLSIQESPMCYPSLVVELAVQTNALQKKLGSGMVRIALECEKRTDKEKVKLLEEPVWNMFCNGKKNGYGVKRDPTEDDLRVMELLRAVSMGAGVLPGNSEIEGPDGDLAYIRAHFDRVVGSKDSETLYMISPDGNSGPELSIFFIRV